MSFRTFMNVLLGRQQPALSLKVAFYKDAALHGMHGSINVSHRGFNLNGQPVRFVFIGVHTPPPATPELLAFLFEEARIQGFIPHHVELYGLLNDRIVTQETLEKLREEGRLGTLEEAIVKAENIQHPMPFTPQDLDAQRPNVTTEASLLARRSPTIPSIGRSAEAV